jgi:hypothetical protein
MSELTQLIMFVAKQIWQVLLDRLKGAPPRVRSVQDLRFSLNDFLL